MKFTGTAIIESDKDNVWNLLTDIKTVSKCVPGLESIEIVEPDRKFTAIASVGIGNIKARFTTDVEWVEMIPASLAKMKAHGTAPGSAADVIAEMRLTTLDSGQTKLDWEADVTILGTIAALASRMMGAVTQKLSAEFFDCVKRQIEN